MLGNSRTQRMLIAHLVGDKFQVQDRFLITDVLPHWQGRCHMDQNIPVSVDWPRLRSRRWRFGRRSQFSLNTTAYPFVWHYVLSNRLIAPINIIWPAIVYTHSVLFCKVGDAINLLHLPTRVQISKATVLSEPTSTHCPIQYSASRCRGPTQLHL